MAGTPDLGNYTAQSAHVVALGGVGIARMTAALMRSPSPVLGLLSTRG
jgi:hypothetical protein